MTLIDTPDFSKVSQQCLNTFTSTYGDNVASYRQLSGTSKSYLLELTLKGGDKHQRLLVATHDGLPDMVNLQEFASFFATSPVADPNKTIQVVQFDTNFKYKDNKCYGFNPQNIDTTQTSSNNEK